MAEIDNVISLLQSKGSMPCAGGKLSQLDHALQAAHLAQLENAPPNLVVAALLHDVGHLLSDGSNPEHAEVGHDWLAQNFPAEVSEPVRLHVDAKRYLCATDRKYLDQLSPSSVQSLRVQGGPMTDTELDAFEEHSHYDSAVKLRKWDDRARKENLAVPPLDAYRETIAKLLKTTGT
jgi:[1-hydroxy-2-(trimethylamino)ethyl]phosphonate dioxygenase